VVKFNLAASAAIVALAAATAASAGNLVQNGGFEDVTLTATQQAQVGAFGFQVTYPGGSLSNAVDGWSSSQGGAYPAAYNLYFFDGATAKLGDAFSQYPGEEQRPNANFTGASPDGGAFMVLDGDPNFTGPLTQTITGLTAGKTYELSFWWAGGELSNRTGYQTIRLDGSFGADAFSTPTFVNSQPAGVAGDFSGWQKYTVKVTAQFATETLSFIGAGTPANNLPPVAFLDGVSLVGVPEPATWAMMLLGVGGLGMSLRRRNRKAAVNA
jgi:hypothetical protein